MTKFRLVLVLLCLALLGALPFLTGLPKPDTAAENDAPVAGPTAVQRQMAAQREAAHPGTPVGARVGRLLMQARNLTYSGRYADALRIVEQLRTDPVNTPHEAAVIAEMHTYVLAKANGPIERQAR